MDLGITGRVAIVAAASKGLGRAVALELAREGAQVAVCARTPATLAETAAHIRKSTGREVFHQALDVTDSAAVASFVSAVEARFGRLDICVTNSGGPPSNSFESTKPEDWRAAVEQLLMSAVFLARETLPYMRKNKWGRLITITSSAVKQPVNGLLLSNSVRAAVTGLARTLANDYAAEGITVNNAHRAPRRPRIQHFRAYRLDARRSLRQLGARNTCTTSRHARGICRRGCLSSFRARQLYHRHFHRCGRRSCQEPALTWMPTMPGHFEPALFPRRFAPFRLAPAAPVPGWATQGSFSSITKTGDGTPIVPEKYLVPAAAQSIRRVLQVHGSFVLTGSFPLWLRHSPRPGSRITRSSLPRPSRPSSPRSNGEDIRFRRSQEE